MKDFYITYWTIGGSQASCGLEPKTIRFHCKAENKEEAVGKLFSKHSNLDNGNIIQIEEA
jgi:hypothetical protein